MLIGLVTKRISRVSPLVLDGITAHHAAPDSKMRAETSLERTDNRFYSSEESAMPDSLFP